ncbi:MAG TPA: Dyp-type peroxidase [Myxococcales bacterium]|jgi:putative iron-dependent peroxidase
MARPQSAILPETGSFGLFLTMLVKPGGGPAVRSLGGALENLAVDVARRSSLPLPVCAMGLGAQCWDEVVARPRPKHLAPFKLVRDGVRVAPSTPADLFFHIHSAHHDANFALAREIRKALGDAVTLVEEIHGFKHFGGRDLTGFVDGTENPKDDDRAPVALVGEEEPGFECGSYVNVQRYVHNLEAWERLPVQEQEGVIGRTKAEGQELAPETKPKTAHIARVVIEEDGKELEILRHSMPYGTTAEAGLYFVAYGKSPENFDKMLARMMVAERHGEHDHLMRFTRAITGCAFFVPSIDFLEDLATT